MFEEEGVADFPSAEGDDLQEGVELHEEGHHVEEEGLHEGEGHPVEDRPACK